MIPMGEDFCFQNAPEFFASSDRLIDYWNTNIMSQTNIELKYSTPSMYIDDLAALDRSWTTRYDDMFPYADNDVTYWTGYYTSRANSKKLIRDGGHVLNSSNKLFALAALDVLQHVDCDVLAKVFFAHAVRGLHDLHQLVVW